MQHVLDGEVANLEFFFIHRACNSVFTALEHCQEGVEITSEDHIIQVEILHTEMPAHEHILCKLTRDEMSDFP